LAGSPDPLKSVSPNGKRFPSMAAQNVSRATPATATPLVGHLPPVLPTSQSDRWMCYVALGFVLASPVARGADPPPAADAAVDTIVVSGTASAATNAPSSARTVVTVPGR
jgi:hypothetical protein